MATRYQLHVQEWRNCQGCSYSESRVNVCLYRGDIPCHVLFVGEAPGKSENILGKPFVGPAGQLLDRIIDDAFGHQTFCKTCEEECDYPTSIQWMGQHGMMTCVNRHEGSVGRRIRYGLTNLVGCIPLGEDGSKTTEPDEAAIEACASRLIEIVEIANPSMIVCVGKLAESWLDPGYRHSIQIPREIRRIEITHPAAILRAKETVRQFQIHRCRVLLTQALEKM